MTVVVSYGTSNLAYFRTLQKLGLYHHAARVFISSLKFWTGRPICVKSGLDFLKLTSAPDS